MVGNVEQACPKAKVQFSNDSPWLVWLMILRQCVFYSLDIRPLPWVKAILPSRAVVPVLSTTGLCNCGVEVITERHFQRLKRRIERLTQLDVPQISRQHCAFRIPWQAICGNPVRRKSGLQCRK